LAVGWLVILAARLAVPTAPPLYDGVVPVGPYVWLDPPPGETGGAQGSTASIPVPGDRAPLVAVATPESVPQAQLFAQPGALTLSGGARSLKASIEPVRPVAVPADGHIDGNVYRIVVTDQDGRALRAPVSAQVSVVLRSVDPTLADAVIGEFADGAWRQLATSPTGFGGTFIAVITGFGDFAVIASGPGPRAVVASPAATRAGAPGSTIAVTASIATTATSAIPPASREETPGISGWLVAGLAVLVVLMLLGSRRVARGGRRPYRGAHPNRRR
jgi:hypothetical protein